ncbi:MAG: molybdopterin-dependent oxidoreductase, partial [Chloroflexota bacterium]
EKFGAIKTDQGANALGGIAGARLSNEDLYLFQKFFRDVIGTHNVDHRIGVSAALEDETAYTVGVGLGTDLGRVGQGTTILVIGSDLDHEAPILFLRVAGASVKRGAHLINAGGRRTKLDAQAQTSLRYHYGTAAYLVLGLLASVVEQGLVNKDWLESHTQGFSDLEASIQAYTPAKVAEITGVSTEEIETTAKAFAEAQNGLILFGLEAGNDPALRAAVEALALVTGHAGRADNGVLAILPHANSRGAADMGVVPDRLPGYQPIEGETGASAQAMVSGAVKGLLLAGVDPAADNDAYRQSLSDLDFLVVQDLFLTETAQLADVVLPAQGVAERDGTYTNLERRVQAFDPGVPTPGQAWADWLIVTALAGQMDADWGYASADGVMAEITQTVSLYRKMQFANLIAPVSLERKTSHYIYEGMSFTGDVREGVQWRTVAESDAPVSLRFIEPEAVSTTSEEGVTLVSPRFLYDGGRLLAEAEIVQPRLTPAEIVLSRVDAEKLAVSNGDQVKISQNGTTIDLPVHINRTLTEGMALLPRNLTGRPAEKLIGEAGLYATVKIEKI